jgi:Mce-associated membrane protein
MLAALTTPVRNILRALTRGLRAIPTTVATSAGRVHDAVVADPARATKALAALTGAVTLLAGLFWFTADRYARTADARIEAGDAAKSLVSSLLSYNFNSIDRQADKTENLRTGAFRDEYAQFINRQVAPSAKDKQIVMLTAVDDTAVIDAGPDTAELLVLVEQQSQSLASPAGTSTTPTLKVTLEKEDDTWKVSEITPV